MHVDDVRERAKNVQRREGPLALLPDLEAYQEVGSDADEDDVINEGFEALHPVRPRLRPELPVKGRSRYEHDGDQGQDAGAHGEAQR